MDKSEIKKYILKPILTSGYEAYFVGGCVRDSILGISPKDFDICTNATPEELHKIFNHFSEQSSEQFGVTMPIVNGELVEIATMRKDITSGRHPTISFTKNITEDAMRRDFTVNALYEDIEGKVIDVVGTSLEDISYRTLRFVGNAKERILEDPLRIFRFVRFISQKGFIPLASDLEKISETVKEVGVKELFKEVSKERQLKELIGIFGGKYFNVGIFDYMDSCGILSAIGLDIIFKDMENTSQSTTWHMEGNVKKHTMNVVREMCSENHDYIDIMAAMLHDIGKPEAGRRNGCKPGITWPCTLGHDEIGAHLAYKFCKSLGMCNEDCETITWLVSNHMLAHKISETNSKYKIWKLLSDRRIERLIKLARSDNHGSIKSKEDEIVDLFDFIKDPEIAKMVGTPMPEPLVKGSDLISLGISPNKNFKKALEVGYAMQINQSETKEHILSNIKNLAK